MGHSSTYTSKVALRKRMRGIRDALERSERDEQSRQACVELLRLDAYIGATTVASYMPIGSELDVRLITHAAQRAGKRVALPQVTGPGRMRFAHYQPQDQLALSALGIAEPLDSAATVDANALDVVIVPGLAFDTGGARLGYGAGHYDRALRHAARAWRVGIAFREQIVATVPVATHDLPMHVTVTCAGARVTDDKS